jgi:hypothetical protein
LEAPPGFEPGMEVLQISYTRSRWWSSLPSGQCKVTVLPGVWAVTVSKWSRLSPPSGGPFERRSLRVEAGPEKLLPPAPACDDEQNSHGHVRQRVERADLTMPMICSWFTSRRMVWREIVEANTQMSVSVSLGMRRPNGFPSVLLQPLGSLCVFTIKHLRVHLSSRQRDCTPDCA